MKIVQWALSRVAEPSSYAGISASVVGIGVLTDNNCCYWNLCGSC